MQTKNGVFFRLLHIMLRQTHYPNKIIGVSLTLPNEVLWNELENF